jgi:nanoRNase/pAp phosphatase (c-di-AMP/oligoRNAs hydrolase)
MSLGVSVSAISTYAILGCGSVGHAIAEELAAQGKDVLIVDKDESRVEALRDQDLNATVADIGDAGIADVVGDREVVLVMASDVEANKAAVEHLVDDQRFVVARAADPVSADALRELGADIVINPASVIAESALRTLESGELEHRAAQLKSILVDTDGQVAIVTPDNPTPDALASAVALQAIAGEFDVEADILYFGGLGHQENRAFVNLLGIDLVESDPNDLAQYATIALVDHSQADSARLADRATVDIVLDHRESDASREARFVDVRPDMASTSTILTKYLQELGVTVDAPVATALLYGIRAETLDFKRETTPADLTAAAYLHPFADHDVLEQVESPSMSPETLDVLAEAITNRQVKGSHLVSNAGFVTDREALAQAAQHLLNLEGVTSTAVFGIAEETIHLAARSKDIRLDIESILADAFDDSGQVVGHSTQASAEIPLGIFTGIEVGEENRDLLLELAEEAVRSKLFAAMGVESENGG